MPTFRKDENLSFRLWLHTDAETSFDLSKTNVYDTIHRKKWAIVFRRVERPEQLGGGKPQHGGGSAIIQEIPSVMPAMAQGNPDNRYNYPQHLPKVIFDEKTFSAGTAVFISITHSWLQD